MLRKDLERLSRDELVSRAEAAGIARPRSLTTAELLDELVLRGDAREDRARARGWFGRARDLLKSAIHRGLDLPDAGQRVAKAATRSWPPAPPPPLPTVTLAEIYAAQGHLERAVQVLDEVLAREPEHGEAGRLRKEYAARADRIVARGDDSERAGGATEATKEARGDRAPVEAATPAATLEVSAEDDEMVDEIVAVAVDPSTIYLYWEVGAEPVARARVEAPSGSLTVRTVSVAPGNAGPLSHVRDDRVDALSGELFVRGLRGGAHVRVSVGWLSGAGFIPLAVGADLSTPRSAPSSEVATELGTWSRPAAAVATEPRGRPTPFIGRSRGGVASAASPGAPSPTRASAPDGGAEAPRRTMLLQPTAVFDVAAGAPVPIGVWQPPGSSELSLLFGSSGARRARGGASDLVLGGASDLSSRSAS